MTKKKALTINDRIEASRAIAKIAHRQRKIDTIELSIEAEIMKVKSAYTSELETARKERNVLLGDLLKFANAKKCELFIGDAKTCEFPTGTLAFRYTPPAVDVADDDATIEALELAGLDAYVRTKKELDRAKILSDRNDLEVEGLGFSQSEIFLVTPSEHCSEIKKTRTIVVE